MSEMQEVTFDPQWDVADRLQKALRLAGMSAPEMARFLSVHRNTMNNWLNGKTAPNHRTLLLWSMKTGVPLPWLEGGDETPTWAPRDSNAQPTDYGSRPRHLVLVRGLNGLARTG